MLLGMLLAMVIQAPANDHEYTDLVRIRASEVLSKYLEQNPVAPEKKKELEDLFKFRDFVGTSLDGKAVNFNLPKGKGFKSTRVLILSYVAEWCKNCNYEAPYLRELYEKYRSKGLEIVARTEYSELSKVKEMIERHKSPYPIILGSQIAYSEREKIRLETFQYLLRNALGDKRKWGTPFSLIIINGDLDNPYVVLGEMKSAQVNELIEKSLSGTN